MRPHLTNAQRQKLSRILPTLYGPLELAALLDIHVSTIRKNWLKQGCPYIKDATGHVLIDGQQFLVWMSRFAPHICLKDDEGYCFVCGTARPMIDPRQVLNKVRQLESDCPVCGQKIHRFTQESIRDIKRK